MKAVPALVAILMSTAASADVWLVAETPAAVAVSDVQANVFRPGAMPAVGAYVDTGWFAVGFRLRAGILRDGNEPGRHLANPGVGGLMTGSFAVRVHKSGAWLETALGGGLTGHDLVPAAELGAGWLFEVGSIEMGPSIRYARVKSYQEMDTLGTADLVLVGVDMRFGKDRSKQSKRIARHIEPAVAAVEEVRAPIERDREPIIEHLPSCAEVVDGCTFGEITIVDDRIVLDERVLFDFERARVRSQGKLIIEAIAKLWRAHPEWQSITIEGHADVRGSDDFNLELSQRRAERVRDVLIAAGHDTTSVHAIGLGRSRPRDAGTTPLAHQHNRRVEFVIERRVEQLQ